MARNPDNRPLIAKVISPANYLNQPETVVMQVLTGKYADGLGNVQNVPDRIDFNPIRKCSVNNSSVQPHEKMTIDSGIHRGHISPQRCRDSPVLFRSSDERARPSERKQMRDFAITSACSNTDRDATGTLDADVDGVNCWAVRHHHRNAFATFGLCGKDRSSDVVSVIVIFGPRIPTSISNECDTLWLHRCTGRNDRADRVVTPPTLCVIPGCRFGICAEKFH
jgi:hypothetical protein